MKASKLMKLEVTTILPDLQLEAAHRLMLRLGVRHLPVVSGQRLAGMLSDRDVLLASGKLTNGSFVYPTLTAGEVMTLAPVSAGPDASVADIARKMVESKIDALPIVSRNNELVGLVTSTDLLLLLTELPRPTPLGFEYEIRPASDLAARA